MPQIDTSYVHIGSTLCLKTAIIKYNTGGYASGTDILIHLRPFLFIAYICGFKKCRQMIKYTKYKWNDKKHHGVFQWARNVQNIIPHDNELKLMNLLR